jgi:hypothetical protein
MISQNRISIKGEDIVDANEDLGFTEISDILSKYHT